MTPHDVESVATAQRRLVQAFQILARYGLGARVAGHLTLRHPEREAFWTHRFGLGFDEVGLDDLVLTDFELATADGRTINPTMHIHAQIYRARPEVKAITHTHGANITALSATEQAAFVACSQMAGIFVGDIASFDEDELIVLDAQPGKAIAHALGARTALILRNHGSLVVGSSLPEALLKTLVLEEAAENSAQGHGDGTDARHLPGIRRPSQALRTAAIGRSSLLGLRNSPSPRDGACKRPRRFRAQRSRRSGRAPRPT